MTIENQNRALLELIGWKTVRPPSEAWGNPSLNPPDKTQAILRAAGRWVEEKK